MQVRLKVLALNVTVRFILTERLITLTLTTLARLMRVLKVLVLLLRFKKKVTPLHLITLALSKVVAMLRMLTVFVLVTLATSVQRLLISLTLEQLILKARLAQPLVYVL